MFLRLLAQAVELDKRNPITTGLAGIFSGVCGWISMQLHALAGIITDLGLIAAGLTSMLVLVIKVARLREGWRERRSIVQHDDDEDGD